MKVTELPADRLDLWVAKARGIETFVPQEDDALHYVANPALPPRKWNPTRFWSQGGPLIEEFHIDLNWDTEGGGHWAASMDPDILAEGETVLLAAMRAYVISCFGEEVEEGAETAAG